MPPDSLKLEKMSLTKVYLYTLPYLQKRTSAVVSSSVVISIPGMDFGTCPFPNQQFPIIAYNWE